MIDNLFKDNLMDNAVVGIITLGSSNILEMPLDQAAKQLGRTLLIDAAATSASYATGIVCEELDLPVAITGKPNAHP